MKRYDMLSLLGGVDNDLILRAKEAKTSRRPLHAIWLVAAVLILSTAVLATALSLWSPGLASQFGADETAQEQLLESGMTSLIDAEPVTLENGLKLTLQQVICDGYEITVVVYYEAPEPGWFTWENRFHAMTHIIPTLTIGDMTFFRSSDGFDLDTVTDTSAYMTWSFTAGDCIPLDIHSADLDGQNATLSLKPPVNYEEVLADMETQAPQYDRWDNPLTGPEAVEAIRNDPLILSEEISFSWTMSMASSIQKSLEGSFTGEYEGITFTLENVVLTPISIRFTMTEGEEILDLLYDTGIVLTDGTEISWHCGGIYNPDSEAESAAGNEWTGYFTFDSTVLDLDSIAGINYSLWAATPVTPGEEVTVYTLPLK